MTGEARRAAVVSDIVDRTGIDEAMISRLVQRFYEAIRSDPMLGPVFETQIADWGPHLERMCAFWSSVALMSGRYHGQPMEKHMKLPVDAEHFDRWLALFARTAEQECPPAAAAHFVDRAQRIAQSLELGVASGAGVLLAPGERYRSQQAA
jgi:hemoglobin